MRKNLSKLVAVAVALALGTMALSALAQQKSAPCQTPAAKAAPAEMKGCAGHGAAAAEMKGPEGCCRMTGGDKPCCAMHAKAAKSGRAMGAKDAKSGCAMGVKSAKSGCTMGAKDAKAGCAMAETCGGARGKDVRGCDYGLHCQKPGCPVHALGAAAAGCGTSR